MAEYVCWSDRKSRTKVNKCHEKWLTSKSGFIAMRHTHSNVMDFMHTAMNINTGRCIKSSLQSLVGAISRRSKLASEMLTINSSGVPLLKVNKLCWRHTVDILQFPERNINVHTMNHKL